MVRPKPRPAESSPLYHADTYRPEATLSFVMGRCLNRVVDAIDAALSPLGLNAEQFGVLHAVHIGLATTPTEMARLRYRHTAAITYTLDGLQQRGLLVRQRSESDRRVVRLVLTDAGRDLVERAVPLNIDAQNRVFAALGRAEHDHLLAVLRPIALHDAKRLP